MQYLKLRMFLGIDHRNQNNFKTVIKLLRILKNFYLQYQSSAFSFISIYQNALNAAPNGHNIFPKTFITFGNRP